MNILSTTLNDAGDRLEHGGFAVPLAPETAARLRERRGRGVLLGIRPEHVAEAGSTDWPSTTRLSGVIEIVETVGHEVIVHVRCGEDLVVAKLGAHRIPGFGDEMTLEMKNDAVHLFDPDTELNLTT